MSDEFPDRGDSTPTSTSFEEWLEQHAASRGISKEELFERLVSSYWTLNEMMQLLEDSGNGDPTESRSGPFDHGARGPTPTSDARETRDVGDADGARGRRDRGRNRAPDRSTDPGRNREPDRRSDPEPARSPPSDASRERAPPSDGGGGGDATAERVADLAERVDALEAKLDDEVERGQSLDRMADAMADRLTAIEGELDELDADLSAERETRAEQHEALVDQQRRLDASQESLAEGQERIREWLDTEFDSLQTILEHLVSRGDDLDAQLSRSEARYEEQLSELRAEREALRSLKREAADHDAHEGACGNCGETIDLDLLSAPYCPDCDASLSGIERRSKWLFLSDTVVTTGEETGEFDGHSDPPSERRRERIPAAERGDSTAETPPDPPEPDRASDTGGTDRTGGERPSFDGETGEANNEGSSFDFGDIEETEPNSPSDESADEGSGPRTRMQIGTPDEEVDDGDGVAGDGADDPLDAPFGDLDDLRRNENGSGDD